MRLRRLRSGTRRDPNLPQRNWDPCHDEDDSHDGCWPHTGLGESDSAPVVPVDPENTPAPPRRDGLAGDPHRPLPSSGAWPDDAVLLTYSELRRLVALHLDLAQQGMPNTKPWWWIKDRARAMRDGETPLLVSEVMEA